MVRADVPKFFFEFSPSRIAKTAFVKSFCKKSMKTMKSVLFEICL